MNDRIGLERDAHTDHGGGRIDDAHALAHPPFVDPVAHARAGLGQLHAVVDTHQLTGFVNDDGVDVLAVTHQHPDHVGEVLLALAVVWPTPR